jgi:hypothetical protein
MSKKGLTEPNRIVWWTIQVEWADGANETLSNIPNHVAKEVDAYLTELEEEQES